MKTAELEKLGLTAETLKTAKLPEDLVKQIIILHGKDIEAHKATIKGHEATISTSEETVKGLNSQLKDANTTIEGFKDLDPESIKKAADDWKATEKQYKKEAKEAAEASDKKFAGLKYDTALNEALKEAKVINPKAVVPLLNTKEIILNEKGELVGFDEQIEALRKSDENQFAPDKDTPRLLDKTNNKTVVSDKMTSAIMEGANLSTEKG